MYSCFPKFCNHKIDIDIQLDSRLPPPHQHPLPWTHPGDASGLRLSFNSFKLLLKLAQWLSPYSHGVRVTAARVVTADYLRDWVPECSSCYGAVHWAWPPAAAWTMSLALADSGGPSAWPEAAEWAWRSRPGQPRLRPGRIISGAAPPGPGTLRLAPAPSGGRSDPGWGGFRVHLETHTRSQTPHFMSYPMDMSHMAWILQHQVSFGKMSDPCQIHVIFIFQKRYIWIYQVYPKLKKLHLVYAWYIFSCHMPYLSMSYSCHKFVRLSGSGSK